MIGRSRRMVAAVAACALAGCGGTATPPLVPATSEPATPPATTVPTRVLPTSRPRPDLVLLAMGDSIPYNAPDDCPGCSGYVAQYGEAIADATSLSVGVLNRSQHTGLTIEGLLNSFANETFTTEVADADAITISIGYNDAPMGVTDDPCDGASGDFPDLEQYTDECIDEWADAFALQFDDVLTQVGELRAGKPTLLSVINVYDWWRGFEQNPDEIDANIDVVRRVLERQNADICRIATEHGFLCADVHGAFNGLKHDQPSGELLAVDYSHPSQSGNDLIARTLIDLGFAPLAP